MEINVIGKLRNRKSCKCYIVNQIISIFVFYRKNSSHKQQFSHPGDPDYDTDPEDARPLCIYGSGCYRKNMLHRAHYRHPKSSN